MDYGQCHSDLFQSCTFKMPLQAYLQGDTDGIACESARESPLSLLGFYLSRNLRDALLSTGNGVQFVKHPEKINIYDKKARTDVKCSI